MYIWMYPFFSIFIYRLYIRSIHRYKVLTQILSWQTFSTHNGEIYSNFTISNLYTWEETLKHFMILPEWILPSQVLPLYLFCAFEDFPPFFYLFVANFYIYFLPLKILPLLLLFANLINFLPFRILPFLPFSISYP